MHTAVQVSIHHNIMTSVLCRHNADCIQQKYVNMSVAVAKTLTVLLVPLQVIVLGVKPYQ